MGVCDASVDADDDADAAPLLPPGEDVAEGGDADDVGGDMLVNAVAIVSERDEGVVSSASLPTPSSCSSSSLDSDG